MQGSLNVSPGSSYRCCCGNLSVATSFSGCHGHTFQFIRVHGSASTPSLRATVQGAHNRGIWCALATVSGLHFRVAQSTDVLEDGGGAELDVAAARSKDPLPKAEPLHEVVRCSRPAGRVSRRHTAVASGMNVPSKVPRKMSRACLQGPWRTCQLWIGGSCVVNRCPSSFLVNPRAAPEGHPLDRDRRSPRPRRPSQPILPRRLALSWVLPSGYKSRKIWPTCGNECDVLAKSST